MRAAISLIILLTAAIVVFGGCRGDETPQAAVRRQLPNRNVPILCYHAIANRAGETYTVPVDEFTAQMDWLIAQGYETITLDQLARYLRGEEDIPPKSIVITFDDGHQSSYEAGWPVLEERGFVATFFVNQDIDSEGKMTSRQLWGLKTAGCEVESHTSTHRILVDLAPWESRDEYEDAIREELQAGIDGLVDKIGAKPRYLAYPNGCYDETVIRIAQELGFTAALTIDHGMNDQKTPPMLLHRAMIMRGDGVDGLKAKVNKLPLHVAELDPGPGTHTAARHPTFTGKILDKVTGNVTISASDMVGTAEVDRETGEFSWTPPQPFQFNRYSARLTMTDAETGMVRDTAWFFILD